MSETTATYLVAKKSQSQEGIKFMGYGKPNFTQVPNLFLREQMAGLTGAEVKVMLYIFAHTFGFTDQHGDRKTADAISFSQFLNGIKSRDGRQLDRGAGVGNGTLGRTLESLVAKGYIFRHTRKRSDGSANPTVYELNIDGKPHWSEETEAGGYSHFGRGVLPKPGEGTPILGVGGTPKVGDTKENYKQNKINKRGVSLPTITKENEEPEPSTLEVKEALIARLTRQATPPPIPAEKLLDDHDGQGPYYLDYYEIGKRPRKIYLSERV